MSSVTVHTLANQLTAQLQPVLNSPAMQALSPEQRLAVAIAAFGLVTNPKADGPSLPPLDERIAAVMPFVGWTSAEVEQAHILATLIKCGGNRTRAAKILNVSLRTVRNKISEYGKQGAEIPLPPNGVKLPALE